MTGIHEFIVEIGDAFHNTLEYGSLKLYTDHRTQQQEQSNRKGKIISTPLKVETDIQEGAEVIIDPTVLFEQYYHGKAQESRYLVDKEKGWYRVTPDMVLTYKNPDATDVLGNKENLLVQPIDDTVEKIGSIFLAKPKNQQESVAVVLITNKEMQEEGVTEGVHIYYNKKANWKFNFEGQDCVLLKNFHVLGIKLNGEGETA